MSFGSWLSFTGGRLELCFAVLFGLIGFLVFLYSLARIRGRGGQIVEYYIFLFILVGAALGVVFANDLLVIFMFWELATVALWRLVSYFRDKDTLLAGSWAFYVNFIAAALMLIGLVLIQFDYGTWNLARLSGKTINLLPAFLLLTGILAKSATLPFYIWLPKAYRQAPAPICALLSGVGENLGVVLFFKVFIVAMPPPPLFLILTATVAVISSFVTGGVALNAKTVRETLAYSTVSQMGFILLAFAAGGYYGLAGGVLYVIAHAIAKAGLFFATGSVEEMTGTGDLDKMGGLAGRLPVLAGATAVLALSIMGLPPTLGFFAKLGVVVAAVQKDLLLGIGAIVTALFTVLYLSRLYARIFLGQGQEQYQNPGSKIAAALVVVMAVITVGTGVLWFAIVRFLETGGVIISRGW